jgi:DNA invertase Pin-like site-specific DNA recombinase
LTRSKTCSKLLFSEPLGEKGTANDCGRLCTGEQRGQSLDIQLEKLKGCDKVFKEKRSGVDTGRPALKQCLEFLRDGDTLLVTKIDRLARSTSDLYRIVSELTEKGVSFKVLDDPSIDTTSRAGKLVLGILALIAEFENDIRRERQMDGIAKAKDRGVKFGKKRELTDDRVKEIRALRESGETVPAIIKRTGFSKATIYRALRQSA